MLSLRKGRYAARLAETPGDLLAAQELRHRAFFGSRQPCTEDRDQDRFDAICQHVLIRDRQSGALVCCFRLLPLRGGDQIGESYSAQFYGLDGLRDCKGPILEMGRFCIDPGHKDPDILRVAWGAMTAYVDAKRVQLLFGCASFRGTETGDYLDAFAMLKARHLAPDRLLPAVKAENVFRFARHLHRKPDVKKAMSTMPPLLRSYLSMGGWVSDHAVIDRELNSLHVFTGLEISAIPPARARLLRATASQSL